MDNFYNLSLENRKKLLLHNHESDLPYPIALGFFNMDNKCSVGDIVYTICFGNSIVTKVVYEYDINNNYIIKYHCGYFDNDKFVIEIYKDHQICLKRSKEVNFKIIEKMNIESQEEEYENVIKLSLNIDKNQETKEEEKEETTCLICMDNKSCYVTVPCGHLCLCKDCNTNDVKLKFNNICPICRCNFTMLMKIYNL